MEEQLRADALEYHLRPTPGKISVTPTKGLATQRDLSLAYSPGVAYACTAIHAEPGRCRAVHLARQPRRGGDQRHGRARPRQHRPAGRQAGHGRQGLPVQEVRRHRRVRHRDQRARSGQARRHHRQPRADFRRHQSRGHQGARVLLHREEAARAHEDPGVPRRPARHGDRRRGGDPQRAQVRRQGHRQRAHGLLGRRRRGARLPRPAGEPRHEAREHARGRQQGRAAQRAQRHGREQTPLCASDRRAHAGRRGQDRRCLHGPVERRRAQARDGQEHGQPAADPGDGQSRTRRSCRRTPRRRAPT